MKKSINPAKVRSGRVYTKERMEELIEVFSDASRRLNLTDEQLAMAPTCEEAMEAIFGSYVVLCNIICR